MMLYGYQSGLVLGEAVSPVADGDTLGWPVGTPVSDPSLLGCINMSHNSLDDSRNPDVGGSHCWRRRDGTW